MIPTSDFQTSLQRSERDMVRFVNDENKAMVGAKDMGGLALTWWIELQVRFWIVRRVEYCDMFSFNIAFTHFRSFASSLNSRLRSPSGLTFYRHWR